MKARTFVVSLVVAPTLLGAFSAFAAPPGWELVATDGDVKVFNRDVTDSSLLAFRGEGSVEASIGRVMNVVMTPERFPEWTDLLIDVAPILVDPPHRIMVWEHYANTWPVSDRDFVYDGRATLHPETRTVTIHYKSVERADVPTQDCCVRGEIVDALFHFTARPDGSTFIECEALIDPKGWLPAFLVNMVQEDWAINTINGLRRQVKEPHVKEDPIFAGWHDPPPPGEGKLPSAQHVQ